ncbi:hypothetical protein WG66_007918 [Moniliophthora roreri]|nr:hypothetical protein WG66_007918 [Moniliophthora roreri]
MLARFSNLLLAFGLISINVLCLATPTDLTTESSDLAGLSIGDIINALGIGLVENIEVTITLDSLVTDLISTQFTAKNPLPLELSLESVSSKATFNGTTFSEFSHTFTKPVIIPILGEKESGKIDNVLLTQGATANLASLTSSKRIWLAGSILGFGGIRIPINGLKQKSVPTAYQLDMGLTNVS